MPLPAVAMPSRKRSPKGDLHMAETPAPLATLLQLPALATFLYVISVGLLLCGGGQVVIPVYHESLISLRRNHESATEHA